MTLERINYEYDLHKHHNLKIKKSAYVSHGLSGIVNLRNTCFMNSILQCLSNTLGLTDYILSAKYMEDLTIQNKQRPEQFVLISYINVVNSLWESNQLIKPKSFFENIAKFHKKYFGLRQQDSHEFLLYTLDLLHTAISYEIEIEIKGEPKTKGDHLMKKSLQTWQSFYEKSYSFMIQTFNGCTINTITCCHCKQEETVFEPYNHLSINLTDSTETLSTHLNTFFSSSETIESFTCENCKMKGCNKETKLWNVPDYLIIQLKRFKQNLSKNTSLVNYPMYDLDMTDYISRDKQDRNHYIYDLYAVNYHSGGLDGGHYTSACKNLDNNWYNYNDANVTKYAGSNLQQQIVSGDAYILFYVRKKMYKNRNTGMMV
jgi:ubiquitin carboxyl-terminal hydrolase 8